MTTKLKKRAEAFTARSTIEQQGDTTCCTKYGAEMVVFPAPSDVTNSQFLSAVELSGVLEFWNHPVEDGYTENDGTPL